eukprot:132981-Rhodomonas_salina.1
MVGWEEDQGHRVLAQGNAGRLRAATGGTKVRGGQALRRCRKRRELRDEGCRQQARSLGVQG